MRSPDAAGALQGTLTPPPRSMFARLRQLVVGFFVYNLVNVVVSFHVFVDVCVSLSIAHATNKGGPSALGGYERAAAAFLFFEFLLSMLACIFAVKAVEEARTMRFLATALSAPQLTRTPAVRPQLKDKKRDEYTRTSIEMGMPL